MDAGTSHASAAHTIRGRQVGRQCSVALLMRSTLSTAGRNSGGRGGKGSWKARFGAHPNGTPPPTPAYMQPMAFVSHGTLQVSSRSSEAGCGLSTLRNTVLPSTPHALSAAAFDIHVPVGTLQGPALHILLSNM